MTYFDKKKSKQTKNKNFIFVLIGGVILLAILGLIFISHKNLSSKKPNPEKSTSGKSENLPLPEENGVCPYNEKSLATFSKHDYEQASEENLAQWKTIPQDYIIKLWKKGYHWSDIIQLWYWNLPETEIPDLKVEQRIGIINGLIIMPNPQTFDDNITKEEKIEKAKANPLVGRVRDLVVIIRKISGSGKINIDKRFGMKHEGEQGDRSQVRKIVNFALRKENISLQQQEVSILWAIGAKNFGNEWDVNCGYSRGSSGGSAIYLALVSALHQKPISCQVAATGNLITSEKEGSINGQKIILEPGTNLPIAGLKDKVMACIEKGINCLVLSKYQSSPNLLTKKDDCNPQIELTFEDYQQVISPTIKEKITVHWASNIQNLRDLVLENKLS